MINEIAPRPQRYSEAQWCLHGVAFKMFGKLKVKFILSCSLNIHEKRAFILFYLFIDFIFILFLAALGLRCSVRALSRCGERGLLFIAVRRLLVAVASFVAEHGL